MNPLKIKVIIGSIRENRFGELPARWILEVANGMDGIALEIVDLKDHMLPMFEEKTSPAYVTGSYPTPEANRWAEIISSADGFIFVTPEYNHAYPSSLKNNLDYLYKEWNNKPVGFIGYGTVGGARAVEQLRLVAVELQMASVRSAVHIPMPWNLRGEDGALKPGALDPFAEGAKTMLQQLEKWGGAMRAMRNVK